LVVAAQAIQFHQEIMLQQVELHLLAQYHPLVVE
tara:strand:+ start:167 stop:268 length:102 start_codon:yes stop_codon:yes gene_type:complete